jgi:hypothetical protein
MLNLKKLKEFQIELIERINNDLREEVEDEVIQFLKSPAFKNNFVAQKNRKETKQSARVLNNWEKEGLIDKINTEDGKFRTYNKSQAIWLDIVTSLREFGFPLDKIRGVKEELFNTRIGKFFPFEFAIMQSVLAEPMILVIYQDAKINLLSNSQYQNLLLIHPIAPHLHFNLLNLATTEFPYNNFTTIEKTSKTQDLSDKEVALLYFIRTGDFESIKIRMKEGDVYLLEGTKKIANKKRITEIINQGDFQDIEIKTQNGEIVHISSTKKIKL